MNMFMLGVLAGVVIFAVLYSVFMLNKLHAGLILVHQMVENQGKAAQMLFMKVNKIEKVTEATMQSAESFVEALRESAEQMMNMRPPRLRNQDDSAQFDDLRSAFDDGIRRMEEDEEDEGEEPEDKWKK